MKKIVCLIIILFFASVEAKHIYREKDYQYSWCMKHQGQLEVQLFDYTRADYITNTEVVEFVLQVNGLNVQVRHFITDCLQVNHLYVF